MSWILSAIGWLTGSRIGQWIGMVLGALGLLAAAFLAGWSKKGQVEAKKALEGYKRTRKEMDDANVPDDPDAATEWLRQRKQRRDL